MNLLVDAPAVGCKRAERKTRAQVLRAICGAGAEFSQADRMAIEAGGDGSVRVRRERDVPEEPGGQRDRSLPFPAPLARERLGGGSPSTSLRTGRAQAGAGRLLEHDLFREPAPTFRDHAWFRNSKARVLS